MCTWPYASVQEQFLGFENDLPAENTSGLNPTAALAVPRETCLTMNGSWGYVPHDADYKEPERLRAVGSWLDTHGDAVYGAGPGPEPTGIPTPGRSGPGPDRAAAPGVTTLPVPCPDTASHDAAPLAAARRRSQARCSPRCGCTSLK
ncbi:hypothetical protein ACWGCP_16595 [Streptomyces niveus]